MKAKKVLFITQEIIPYVPESSLALAGRTIPQSVQECGHEIRTFMPRWGNINERRNQLHEVIRLSGMNIIIDDTDHPLIIKVASIQSARMQVYFIDNDDYFHKRQMMFDENGQEYTDNVERAIFYARGVLETVKKLRWCPDVIHCQGWMSAIAPLYIKTAYREDPPFANARVVYSDFNVYPTTGLGERFAESLAFRGASIDLLERQGVDFSAPDALGQMAAGFSDGLVLAEGQDAGSLAQFAAAHNIPTLANPVGTDKEKAQAYSDFYEQVFGM